MIVDDTLDNDAPDGDNVIVIIMLMKIIVIIFIGNNDRNHHNDDNDDDNGNNYDNDNDDQTIMVFQVMHFGEPFACEKAEFCESAQILICLHSVSPCHIYQVKLSFFSKIIESRAQDLYVKLGNTGNPNTNIPNI